MGTYPWALGLEHGDSSRLKRPFEFAKIIRSQVKGKTVKSAIPLVNNVYWVGANDRETDLFEGMWPLPRGISYNCYLIAGQKIALLDTVKKSSLPACLKRVSDVLGAKPQIDYLVIHHLEPDHSGSLPILFLS